MISQCMIVKNEAVNIERALAWGKGLVSEQIVVDTGSADNTVEISKRLGAQVYHFDWIDDFAAAKNYAIEKAQGEWIVFLDADEYLVSEDAEKLSCLLSENLCNSYDAILIGCLNLDENGEVFSVGRQIRIFRNLSKLRYRRRIHEQLEFTDGSAMRVGDWTNEIAILHDGYQGRVYEAKKKSDRNYVLIEKELLEHPLDYEMMGYMGDEYYSEEQWAEAANWYEKSIHLMPDQLNQSDQRSAATFTGLLRIMTEQFPQENEKIHAIYDRGTRLLPEEADLDYMMARYYLVCGEYGRAKEYVLQALKKLEMYGCSGKAMIIAANQDDAWGILVMSCYHRREKKETVQYAVLLLKNWPYTMQTLCILIIILSEDGKNKENSAVEIEEFLEGLYNFTQMKDRMFVWKAAQKAGADQLAARLLLRFSEAELAWIKKEDRLT